MSDELPAGAGEDRSSVLQICPVVHAAGSTTVACMRNSEPFFRDTTVWEDLSHLDHPHQMHYT